jgi:hypothetical protein
MPISSTSSYLPTTDEFIAHWRAANTALPVANVIILAGNTTVADLQTLRDTLAVQRADIEDHRNQLEGARADIEILKVSLLERLNQFNGKLTSLSPASRWTAMQPKAYSRTDGPGKVLPVLDELHSLWIAYEEEVATLTLMAGYTSNDYENQLTALKAAYTAYTQAEVALGLARGSRNETQNKIRPILRQYRQRIPSEFAEGSAILATLPAYSPPDTGRTPDPVTLSGSYNPTTQETDLTWTPVTDADVTQLELRYSVGPEFDAEDESTAATFSPAAAPNWSGKVGPTQPGTAVTYKLYAKTATGRERGSNPLTITISTS